MLGLCQSSSTGGSGCPLGQHIPQREAGGLPQSYLATFLPLHLLSILLCHGGDAKAKVEKQRKPLLLLGFVLLRWRFLNNPVSTQVQYKGRDADDSFYIPYFLFLSPVSSPNHPRLGGLGFRLFASFSTSYCPSRLGTHFTDQTASTLWRKVPLSPVDSVLHMFEDEM